MDSSPIISLLTEDLLANVISKLTHDSDRKSFRLVCKAFLRVYSLHRRSIRVLRPEFIPHILLKFPNIESLDLSVCPPIDDGTVTAAAAVGWVMGLRKIIMSRLTGLSASGMEILIRACPHLEVVDVSFCCGFGDMMAAALSCAGGLRELSLDKCVGVSDVGLAKIAIACEKLEILSLRWCIEITDLGIDLLSKKSANLHHLNISYLKVTNESLRSIGNMKKLTELDMVGLKSVDDVGLHFIGEGCPSLESIDVSRCINVSSSGLVSIIQGHHGLLKLNAGYNFFEISTTVLGWFKDLTNLKTIRLDGARVSDSSLQIISSNCRFLEEIGLSKCKYVTDESIMQLVMCCINLKILDLTCCTALTDVAIAAIAESCRNLLCLKLESCGLLTEESLNSLGSRCSLLQDLDLTDCSGVNDKGLSYLSKCSELVCLKLGLCTNISDKGLSYIASNCSKIQELDLYRCIGIGDDGLAALSNGCKKVKKLNLSYCHEVTDVGMKYLSLLKELAYLELRSLMNITGVGLSSLASGCKGLVELDLKQCENITDSGFWDLAYHARNLRQINLCGCSISDVGLCMLMGNLSCLQDAKLVNLINVSVNGFELALRGSCRRLKKVKLLAFLKVHLSPQVVEYLRARGCKIKWD